MTSSTNDEATEIYLKRIFTSGYMLGRKHGYSDAVEESYPELHEGEDNVGQRVGDAITDYLNPHNLPRDPNNDFSS